MASESKICKFSKYNFSQVNDKLFFFFFVWMLRMGADEGQRCKAEVWEAECRSTATDSWESVLGLSV